MDAQTHAQTRTALPKSLQSTSSTSCLLMCAPLQSHLVANPTIDALKHALKHARHSQKQYSPQAAQAACSHVPPFILTSSRIPPQTRSNTRSNTRGTPKNSTVHKQHKLPAHVCPLTFSPRRQSHHKRAQTRAQTRAALPKTLQSTSSTSCLLTCAPFHSHLVTNPTTDALKHVRHSHKHCSPQAAHATCSHVPPYTLTWSRIPPQMRSNTRGTPTNTVGLRAPISSISFFTSPCQ